jgi:large subunit ribosomal protein L4
MALQVVKQDGKKSDRNVTLSDAIYAIEPNDHAIWLDVKSFLANQRQGTHKSKQRNEISGSSKKIKKQKGTGGARAGNIKNPQFKGGGRVFGPAPRDYSFKLNKKVKDLARRSALTYKAKDNAIAILEDFNFEKPQTKQFIKLIDSLSLNDKKTLFVIPEANRNISLSGRNVGKAKVITASQINTYDVINADQLVLVEGAVTKIDSLLTEKQ